MTVAGKYASPAPSPGNNAVEVSVAQRLFAFESRILAAILCLAVAVRIFVVVRFSINADEFHYLADVHDHLRGALQVKLQTFHVHFFSWVARLPLDEAAQIIVARWVMLGLHVITAALLYRLARRVTDGLSARFAAAAYLSVSFVVWTGVSFRVDPIAICLIMGALNLLLSESGALWRNSLAGLLLATAAMITIKTALFAPTLLLLLGAPLLRRDTVGLGARRALPTILVAIASFAVMYTVHSRGIGNTVPRSSAQFMAGALTKTIAEAGIFPRREILALTLTWDLAFWACWLAGLGLLVGRIRTSPGAERARWLEVGALALPVASLAFYRNSFTYFYQFILPPASVVLGLVWHALSQAAASRPTRASPVVVKAIVLLWCVASLVVHGLYMPTVLSLRPQQRVLAVVHRAFPSPVPYLDAYSAVATFPQVGFFMTSWGVEEYLNRGVPVLKEAIEEHQPPLLLANHALLDLDSAVFPPGQYGQLVNTDLQALRSAFIHHWGPIYVAGMTFDVPDGRQAVTMDVRIGGPYTLESSVPISIDGRVVAPRDPVTLARGPHRFASTGSTERITLRWGEGLFRPSHPPPPVLPVLGF